MDKCLGRASIVAGIVSVIATAYDQYAARKRAREQAVADHRLADLEARLAAIESKTKGA